MKKNKIKGKEFLYKYAICDHDGPVTLYTSSKPCCNSLYPLNPDLPRDIAELMNLGKNNGTFTVEGKKISTLVKEHKEIDILKLDVHGVEYDILKDLEKERYLDDVVLIQVEMWIQPHYSSIHLCDDVHEVLISNGFVASKFIGEPAITWMDVIYINTMTKKAEKLSFLKNLYGINDDTISDCTNRLNIVIEEMGKDGK